MNLLKILRLDKKNKLKAIVFCGIMSLFLLSHTHSTSAAEPLTAAGMGNSFVISDTGITTGDIVSFENGKYVLSKTEYDPNIFGVVSDNPVISYVDTTLKGSRIVVSSGLAYVQVSTKNGAIKKGDYITSSTTKGVGEKATAAGYVVGSAEEDYTDTTKTGSILVTLHPEFGKQTQNDVKTNLLTVLKDSAKVATLSPLQALRFVAAAVVAIVSFVLGFGFFGRVSSRGVEAVGRNPLASRMILLSVVFNVILTLVIMAVGVAVAYFILVL